MEKIRNATCTELRKLSQTILDGWLLSRKQCDSSCLTFWNYRDELVANPGIILKGTRVVVPPSMQHEILQQPHVSHLGQTEHEKLLRVMKNLGIESIILLEIIGFITAVHNAA